MSACQGDVLTLQRGAVNKLRAAQQYVTRSEQITVVGQLRYAEGQVALTQQAAVVQQSAS
ncbi:hypothetical protein D3C75_1270130 [compost metagenome]